MPSGIPCLPVIDCVRRYPGRWDRPWDAGLELADGHVDACEVRLALSAAFCGKIRFYTGVEDPPGGKIMAQDIKSKALDLALRQIEKQFGKGSIMKLG